MPDPIFEVPRLAQIYDPFIDPDRRDLDAYVAMVEEFKVRSVLDIGCGTGTFACLLANRGVEVIGVDPAAASLDVARAKPGAQRVRWVHGDAARVPPIQVDLVTMTGNVAQVFLTDEDWSVTLGSARRALRADGRLIFETRDPEAKAWLGWNRVATYRKAEVEGIGALEAWIDVTDAQAGLVSFRYTFVFRANGQVLTSDSTLRFRSREEVTTSLLSAGLVVDEIRDAPDRPRSEFVARRLARSESSS